MPRLPRRLKPDEEATLVEHLGELRTRIYICLAALIAGVSVSFTFHRNLIHWLELALPPERRQLITISPAEPFLTAMWISIYAGFILAMPIILWQVWSFMAPALAEKTQRSIAGLVTFATALAAGGLAFAYFIVLPAAIHFLTNYDKNLFFIQIRAKEYLSFSTMVLIAVAVVFEVPIFVLALVRIGIMTSAKLRRTWRVGVVTMAALAVALPGVDPVTTTIEMIPLVSLYLLSIALSGFFERRWHPARHGRLAEEV